MPSQIITQSVWLCLQANKHLLVIATAGGDADDAAAVAVVACFVDWRSPHPHSTLL